MEITYEEAVKNYTDYFEARDHDKDLKLVIENGIKPPPALDSAEMLEPEVSFARKTAFVEQLLMDNVVSIYMGDKQLCSFNINKNMSIVNVRELINYPYLLRFLVNTVFGIFLKNCYPHLSN